MERIPTRALERIVGGVNLMPGTLADQIGAARTLLVFLRHFGCVFCRETVNDLRAATEADPDFPPLIFFFQDSTMAGKAFLRQYWPGARAVADEERFFYDAFGIERGGLFSLLGPGVWSAKRRAEAKGLAQGPSSGDVRLMPGLFLVEGDRILWQHEFRHAGDHPDFARLGELVRAVA